MADPKVVRAIIRIGKRRGVPTKHIKSALATGIVESGLRNLGGGDADSAGWRQERASLYKNPTNINASVNRYYNETKQLDKGQSSAQLSADVQRPAAQYRGRYGESSVQSQAAQLLKSGGGGGSGSGSGGRSRTRTTGFTPQTTTVSQEQTFDEAGYEQARRSALVGQMLAKRRGTGGILFKSGLLSTEMPSQAEFQDTKLVTKTSPGTRPRLVSGGGGGDTTESTNAAISWAAKQIGVKETSGANRGKQIDKWSKQFGMVAVPWCGIFTGMALKKAGKQGIGSWIASVAAIEQKAKSKSGPFEGWTSPKGARPGDLLVTRSGGHVELVTKVKGNVIHTVGGNTSDSVARRTHAMNTVHGVARVR